MADIEKCRIYIGVIPGPFNKNWSSFLIITISVLNMVPNMSDPMVIILMVVISMSNNLGYMHNKNI